MTTTNMTVEGLIIDGQTVAAANGDTIDVYRLRWRGDRGAINVHYVLPAGDPFLRR